MGPGSGYKGGTIVFNGDQKSFLKCKESNTNMFLTNKRKEIYSPRPVGLKEYKYFIEKNELISPKIAKAEKYVPDLSLKVKSWPNIK